MSAKCKASIDYDSDVSLNSYCKEIDGIEAQITAHKEQIELLQKRRWELAEKIQAIDMDILLECIVDKGISSTEMISLINRFDKAV